MEKTLTPANPHLAFEPAIVDPEAEVAIPEFIGLKEAGKDRLCELLQGCINDGDTHSETFALISQRVATPQELMFLGHAYFSMIEADAKEAAMTKSLAKAILGL